jgi:hypothetical protein
VVELRAVCVFDFFLRKEDENRVSEHPYSSTILSKGERVEQWKDSNVEGFKSKWNGRNFRFLAFPLNTGLLHNLAPFLHTCFLTTRGVVLSLTPSSSEQPIVVSVDRSSSVGLHIFDMVKVVIVIVCKKTSEIAWYVSRRKSWTCFAVLSISAELSTNRNLISSLTMHD